MAFTFFMRDQHTLEHAVRHTLDYAMGRCRLRVWDAGCAQGQEAYTLAVLFAEKMGYFGFKNLIIDASDYDRENRFGDRVVNAQYKYDELKRIPVELFDKYFEDGHAPCSFKLVEKIRNAVNFRYHDLLSLKEFSGNYSLVVCKNVLLHFLPEQRVEVLKMFHRSLAPGGYLATEQTQKMPPEAAHLFEKVISDAELYRKVGE
jgi:chemotaxis protein methyltransferase CheR